MKRVWLGVLVAVVWAVPAQGATLSPSPQPFTSWLARSYVSWPYETIDFATGEDPCGGGAWVCADSPPGGALFVGARTGARQKPFLWAVGVAAEGALTANQRERAAHLLGYRHWRAFGSAYPFAPAYARCAINPENRQPICVRMLRTL